MSPRRSRKGGVVPRFSTARPGERPDGDGGTVLEAIAVVDALRSEGKSPQGVVAVLFTGLALVLDGTHPDPAEADEKVGHAERLLRDALAEVRAVRRRAAAARGH